MSAATRLFASDRACMAAVIAAGLLLTVPGLGTRDLWDPDEPRTAAVTRGIAEGGTWAAPRLDGRTWLEKPPLYYWLTAAASRAAGRVDEGTVRLPGNAAAILCALAVFALGRGLWGRRAGLLAAFALLTTEDFVIEARWARPDMLLGLLLTLAAFAAWKTCSGGAARVRWPWPAAFWCAIGLGILVKGPVALLPIAGVLVFAAATRRPSVVGALRPGWGPAIALLPVAAWAIAWQAASGAPFPFADLLARFGSRLTQGIHHPHPPAHLLTTLPLALLPWIAVLPAAIAEIRPRRGERHDEASIFVLSLAVADLALFAMAAEKRGVYLLPMLPLMALLVGRLWDLRLYAWDPPPPARLLAGGFAAWLAIVAAGSTWALARLGAEAPALVRPGAVLAGAALVAAGLPLLLWRRVGAGGALTVFAAGAALCAVIVVHVVLPALEPYKSARDLGGRVAAAAGDAPAAIFPDPHEGIAWYAGRRLALLPSSGALAAFLSGPRRSIVVAEQEAWDGLAPRIGAAGRVIDRGRVGHRAFVLVEGAPAAPEPVPPGPVSPEPASERSP